MYTSANTLSPFDLLGDVVMLYGHFVGRDPQELMVSPNHRGEPRALTYVL